MPEIKKVEFPNFGGGLNTRSIPTELENDEVVEALNMEYDRDDNLSTMLGTTKLNTVAPANFGGRVTSIFGFLNSAGVWKTIVTAQAEIYKDAGAGSFTSIKGGIAGGLPSDTFWQWRGMNQLAIGVNGGGGGTANPIKWDGGAGNIVALGGTPPATAKYIEVWNSRCWLVATANPNRLYWSDLGNSENWTGTLSGQIEIGFDDGDIITGIYAHKDRLFIFKRNRIYQLITGVNGYIKTDQAGWVVQLLTPNLGCVSGYTIQSVMNDVVFLSDAGVMSLSAVQEYGDARHSLISDKVLELSQINRGIDTFGSVVLPEEAQYWLSVPDSRAGTTNNIVFILDFSNPQKSRWVTADGLRAGSCYGIVQESGRKRLYIGGTGATAHIYRFGDSGVYDDNGVAYRKIVTTKPLALGEFFSDKIFDHWALAVRIVDITTVVTVAYRLDEADTKKHSESYAFEVTSNDALWDVSAYDVGTFAVTPVFDRDVTRRISANPPGRVGQTIQFTFSNQNVDEAFTLKHFKLAAGLMREHRTTDI